MKKRMLIASALCLSTGLLSELLDQKEQLVNYVLCFVGLLSLAVENLMILFRLVFPQYLRLPNVTGILCSNQLIDNAWKIIFRIWEWAKLGLIWLVWSLTVDQTSWWDLIFLATSSPLKEYSTASFSKHEVCFGLRVMLQLFLLIMVEELEGWTS